MWHSEAQFIRLVNLIPSRQIYKKEKKTFCLYTRRQTHTLLLTQWPTSLCELLFHAFAIHNSRPLQPAAASLSLWLCLCCPRRHSILQLSQFWSSLISTSTTREQRELSLAEYYWTAVRDTQSGWHHANITSTIQIEALPPLSAL